MDDSSDSSFPSSLSSPITPSLYPDLDPFNLYPGASEMDIETARANSLSIASFYDSHPREDLARRMSLVCSSSSPSPSLPTPLTILRRQMNSKEEQVSSRLYGPEDKAADDSNASRPLLTLEYNSYENPAESVAEVTMDYLPLTLSVGNRCLNIYSWLLFFLSSFLFILRIANIYVLYLYNLFDSPWMPFRSSLFFNCNL